MNILFVCLGNICRSPIAAGIMSEIYQTQRLKGVIDSAGTENWNAGKSADGRAILIASRKGIDISGHRARQVRPDDFQRFDVIYAMDRQNERALRKMAPPDKVFKIKRIRLAPANSPEADVPDPYHGNESQFQTVYDLLYERCTDLASKIPNL